MGSTTFSGAVRVGKKPYAAGVTRLSLAVDASVVGATGISLPPGSIVLGGVADEDSVEVTVSDGASTATVTTSAAGVSTDASGASARPIKGPGEVTVVTAPAGGNMFIHYIIPDARMGANT